MIYKKSGPPNTPLAPVTYEFLAPTRVTVRYPNGEEWLTGYGIGEQITVLELSCQYLVANHEKLTEIPMADGSVIIGWDDNIRTKMVWPDRYSLNAGADGARGIPV